MKNFKKVLALVLAIATLLSFATVASAKTADFADAKDVKNTEAVDVLSYIKVLEGYPADNTFKPAKNITREEAAKIIAIFANKSTDISSLYTSANPFADMKGRWGESYVAYGYRAGIIAGKNATSFVPKANVKGTEFLKMVLVVLGYDQNKEGLVGSSWAVNTLELAKAKKLLAGLGKDFDANAALTRDQAAQIMLNALKAEKVVYGQTVTNLVWDAKNGYWTIGNTAVAAAAVYVSPNGAQNNYAHELLAKDFGLTLVASQDKWGRPTHTWNKGTATIGEYVDSDKLVKSYTTAVTECDVATAAGLKAKKVYKLFVNGTESTYEVQPTDTFTKIGAQGRLTEVYEDRIVMVDTFLAQVHTVVEPAFDAAGHLKTTAKITLNVYDRATADGTIYTQLSLDNGGTSFGYAKGDFVLVNAFTTGGTYNVTGTVAQAPNTVYGEIVGKAESFEGAQTIIWHNANKHTVGGTAYDDAVAFNYDEAQKNIGSYTWFKDQYGNLIGDVKVATVFSYGVITSMKYDVTTAKVTADVKYIDGTDNTVTVSSINLGEAGGKGRTPLLDNTYTSSNTVMRFSNDYFYVSIDPKVNALADDIKASATTAGREDIIDGHLMRIETLADSTVAMTKVTTEFPVANGTKLDARYGILTNGIKVDSETLFLVGTKDSKGVYSYKAYKGVNEVPTFSTGAIVDYVASNGYAKYVYIIGAADQAITNGFVYIANNAYYEELYTDANGVQYYKLDLVVPAEDGSKATLTIKSTSSYTKGGTVMTGKQVKDTLTQATNNGVLYYVTFQDGYAVFAERVLYTDNTRYNAADANTGAVAYTSIAPYAYATYGNSILTLGTMSFNTSAATEVVGKLEATMVDKQIYVIYNTDTRFVSKIYVSDFDTGINPTPVKSISAIAFEASAPQYGVSAPADFKVTATVDSKADPAAVASYTAEFYNLATGDAVSYVGAKGALGVRIKGLTIASGYSFGGTPTLKLGTTTVTLTKTVDGYVGVITIA